MQHQASLGIALLRVTFGLILLAHGWLKIDVFTIGGTVQFFGSLGYPAIFAYLTIFGEIFGGIALIVGFNTRLVALLSLPILIGAFFVHVGNGWLFSNQGGGWEFPAALVSMALALVLTGGGAFKVPSLLNRYLPAALKS